MKIAIYGSRRQQPYSHSIQMLIRRLVLSDVHILMARKLYQHLSDLDLNLDGVALAPELFPTDVDMVMSIGGDGTFLRTAAWVGMAETPILGINTGHLGYLAGVSLDELLENLDAFLTEKPEVESRTLIEVVEPEVHGTSFALNEVTIAKEDSASMIVANTKINGRQLADYRADGLIVCTPTGSTAYNLSVGGPIVEPTAPVWVISPIAAHSLSMRPMVVADSSEIIVDVSGRGHSFRLSVDGRSTTRPMDSRVVLRRAGFCTNIVRSKATEFPEPLRKKLMFN